MHEMSIALSIIDIAEKEARKAEAKVINDIELDIGSLSGIELQALQFAFEAVKDGTMLQTAEININFIEAKALCANCKVKFALENYFSSCPECDSFNYKMITGKELKLKSINVD